MLHFKYLYINLLSAEEISTLIANIFLCITLVDIRLSTTKYAQLFIAVWLV